MKKQTQETDGSIKEPDAGETRQVTADIAVETVHKDVEPPPVAPIEPGIEPPPAQKESDATTQLANDAIIETLCLIIGKTMVGLTKIPELTFDEDEIEQLKIVWRGVIPPVSPLASAILVTGVIVGGKLGIYFEKRGEANGTAVPPKEPGSAIPATA